MFPIFVLDSGCLDCVIHIDNKTGRPVPVDFEKYIPFFLQDNPDESCAKAGHASYGQVCTVSVSILFRN
jgi:Niemann-Pick C1 protein